MMTVLEQGGSPLITLIVQGIPIPCDKTVLTAASPYFEAMFRGDFEEARACAVRIHDVTAESMQAIVQNLQTGDGLCMTDWSTDAALDILYAASVLQLDSIQSTCVQSISNAMHTHNCLRVWFIAEQLGLHSLRDGACLMSQWAFETVVESDSFRSLSFDQVNRYMAGHLHVTSEMKVFEALCVWIQQEETDRRKHLSDLMQNLDYSQITSSEIQIMMAHPVLRNASSKLAYSWVFSLLKTYCSPLLVFPTSLWAWAVKYFRKTENILETPFPPTEKRSKNMPAKVYFVATGVCVNRQYQTRVNSQLHDITSGRYLRRKLFYLDSASGALTCSKFNDLLEQPGHIGTIHKLFSVESEVWLVANQETVGQTVFSFWKFNAITNSWVLVTRLPPHMRYAIDWLVYFKNHIYIMYDLPHQMGTQVMDMFNVVTRQWTHIDLPSDDDFNLDKECGMFFSYEDHLYIIASWFLSGFSLQVSSGAGGHDSAGWKRMTWRMKRDASDYKMVHCLVDRTHLYGLSCTGLLYKMQVQGENFLRCDYHSDYWAGDLHSEHHLCGRLLSRDIAAWDGRIYSWSAASHYLTLYDVGRRMKTEIRLRFVNRMGQLDTGWDGWEVVLDSCFVLPDECD